MIHSISDYDREYLLNLKNKLSSDSINIFDRIKNLSKSIFFKGDRELVEKIKSISAFELTKIVKLYFLESILTGVNKNPAQALKQLTHLIPLDKLQESSKNNIEDVLEETRERAEEALYYFNKTEERISFSLRGFVKDLLESLLSVIDNILLTFGLSDLFKQAETQDEAMMKSSKLMMLVSLAQMLAYLIPLFTAIEIGTDLLVKVVLGVAAFSAIWPFIKPMPSHLPMAKNLTEDVKRGRIVAQGRAESLNQIAAILENNRHAILVGPSRVGKTVTARALVRAIEAGDYPELAGKKVFYINAAKLLASTKDFREDPLKNISEAMGSHRDNIILVIDEIHMACKKDGIIADQLKTYLDEGGEFSHVIGITTDAEYKSLVLENKAFSLRFDPVEIQSTDREETLKILADKVLRHKAKPLLEGDALVEIYERSMAEDGLSQPTASLQLLDQCIHKTRCTQISATKKQLDETSGKIASVYAQAAVRGSRKKELKEDLAEWKSKLKKLEAEFAREQKEFQGLQDAKQMLDRVKKETYATLIKLSKLSQTEINSKNEAPLKEFLMLQEFFTESLKLYIKDKSDNLGVKIIIDQPLIEAVS